MSASYNDEKQAYIFKIYDRYYWLLLVGCSEECSLWVCTKWEAMGTDRGGRKYTQNSKRNLNLANVALVK